MCGIAGIFNFDKQAASEKCLKAMSDAIAHRGPDGEGGFVEEYVGLGNRRLAILDVSSYGHQHMSSHNEEWVIVFNGCIYNFPALKKELESKGHSFRSTSDTEVIAEGLAEYGPFFFERLDGMFAIAAWHKTKKELWLSRDRFG